VAADSGFSEAVQFELCDYAVAIRLMQELAPTRPARFHQGVDCCLVTVFLRPVSGDLARLLRHVEDFVAAESLGALRFELDGRGYVLRAGEVDWASAPAGTTEILPSG
jgi:hypothetical protein